MRDFKRFKKVSCLVIEDIPEQLNMLRRILDGRFDQCFYATNGIEGLNILLQELESKEQFLVITDYKMPDMDAAEMIAKLQKICDGSGMAIPPILLLTAYDFAREACKADSMILKPADDQTILDGIDRLLHEKGFVF